jgi:hypothetical protein
LNRIAQQYDSLLSDTDNIWNIVPSNNENRQELCAEWQKFNNNTQNKKALFDYFDTIKKSYTDETNKQDKLKSESKNLLTLLQQRKDIIEKKLSEQSTKADLTDKLWIVIGMIGFFSISAIMAVKLFDEPIQIEWVASGQVIQFVTVMILLSVIMALGLAGILKENTLGTLLGGIAGYVLAQGVGRSAAHGAARDRNQQIIATQLKPTASEDNPN